MAQDIMATVSQKKIVLVADGLKPRVAKIGYSLLKIGWTVTLCLNKKNIQDVENTDFAFYTEFIPFISEEELLDICHREKALVYHIFAEAEVPPWAERLIREKSSIGKIIFDLYDVYRDFMSAKMDTYALREKFCLENADGLCCRMFETQYLKRRYHYKFQGKRILFFDYCWNRFRHDDNTGRHEPLKFVCGGSLRPRPLRNDAKNEIKVAEYKLELAGIKHITKVVAENKGTFVWVMSKIYAEADRYTVYSTLSRHTKSFFMVEPLDYEALIAYEAQFSYGLDNIEPAKDLAYYRKMIPGYCREEKNRYYATNKYFDYLDAGIPPIYGRKGELFGRYLARYGGAVYCPLEEFAGRYDELVRELPNNKEKARLARERFSLDNQIMRLVHFYEKI